MRLDRWRIKKIRNLGKWVVLAPGNRFRPEAVLDSHADAIQFLAVRQRWSEVGFR